MKKIRPKIRKYTVYNVPLELLELNDVMKLNEFFNFLPINTKYYKLLRTSVKKTDHYAYRNIEFAFEKLQNLKSYT